MNGMNEWMLANSRNAQGIKVGGWWKSSEKNESVRQSAVCQMSALLMPDDEQQHLLVLRVRSALTQNSMNGNASLSMKGEEWGRGNRWMNLSTTRNAAMPEWVGVWWNGNSFSVNKSKIIHFEAIREWLAMDGWPVDDRDACIFISVMIRGEWMGEWKVGWLAHSAYSFFNGWILSASTRPAIKISISLLLLPIRASTDLTVWKECDLCEPECYIFE